MKEQTRPQSPDHEVDESIAEFVNAAVEMLRESYHSDLESFEAYAERVKGQMVKQLENYRARLTHGYEVLLEEIARREATKR